MRKNTNDLARFAVDHDASADRGGVGAELVLPIAVGEDDGLRGTRQVVFATEEPPKLGGDTQNRKRAVGDEQGADAFRFGEAGDADGIAAVEADVLEGLVLIAIDKVERGRGLQLGDVDAGSGLAPR